MLSAWPGVSPPGASPPPGDCRWPLQLAGDLAAAEAVGLAGVGALLLGLAPLGYLMIAEPDEGPIHPPPFGGVRPMVDASTGAKEKQ